LNLSEERKFTSVKRSPIYKLAYLFFLQRSERRILKDSSITVFIAELDRIRIENHYSLDLKKKGIIVNPTYMFETLNDNLNKTKSIVFLGTMSWYPNIDGVIHFVQNYFNKLVLIDSSWKFYIVGSNPSIEILRLASSNIIITGAVEDVNPYLIDCMFSIVPNRLGSGLKIKFHESIMKGIPTIVN
jgi:hypothetical protein